MPVKKAVSITPAGWEDQLTAPPPPKPVAVAVQPAEAPAVAKPLRSLEEVRADLARLRKNAQQRHAPVPVKRDTHFEPTDFQEFVLPAEPALVNDSYAPTAYMGFTTLKPLPPAPPRDQ
jgi:hypothetical protein